MRFHVPKFPISVNLWRWSSWLGSFTSLPAPDVISVANLTPGARETGRLLSSSFILLPYACDVRSSQSGNYSTFPPPDPDLCECPAGSARYFTIVGVEYISLGFASQHQVACIVRGYAKPTPPPIRPPTEAVVIGVQNGVNPDFTIVGSFTTAEVYVNGIRMSKSDDYNLVGNVIEFFTGAIPQVGDDLYVETQ